MKIKNAKLIQTACPLKKSTRPVTSPTCNSSSRCWEYSLGTVSVTIPKRRLEGGPHIQAVQTEKKNGVNPLPLLEVVATNQATGLMIWAFLPCWQIRSRRPAPLFAALPGSPSASEWKSWNWRPFQSSHVLLMWSFNGKTLNPTKMYFRLDTCI